jgi:hypothetical protein
MTTTRARACRRASSATGSSGDGWRIAQARACSGEEEAAKKPKKTGSGASAAGRGRAADRWLRAVVIKNEKLVLERLPCARMYERSFMHRDNVTHVRGPRRCLLLLRTLTCVRGVDRHHQD